MYTDGEPVPNSAVELGEIRVTDRTFSATVPYDTTPHWLNNNMNRGLYGKMLLTKDTVILGGCPNPFSEQYTAYQDGLERKQMSPHTIHVGAGYSHVVSEILAWGI